MLALLIGMVVMAFIFSISSMIKNCQYKGDLKARTQSLKALLVREWPNGTKGITMHVGDSCAYINVQVSDESMLCIPRGAGTLTA